MMLLSTQLMAQSSVKIKSRVEIKPAGNQIQYSINGSEPLPPTSYISDCSGTYLAWVMIAAKNSAPSEGPFTVAFRDTARDTTMVFRLSDCINYRDSRSEGDYDCCNKRPDHSCTPLNSTAYFAYSTDPYLPIRIPYILKGDTLSFSYDNCTQPARTGAGMQVQFAKRDAYADKCDAYMEGDLQELELCGIDLTPMSFSVWQDDDTLISGSSTMLNIYPNGDLYRYYPQIDDSLMTIEVDSAQYVKFIYDKGTRIDTLDSPMDSVKFSDAISGKIKFLAMGKQPEKPVPVAICARLMSDPSKVFEDTIVVKGSEILLGETKYYYATQETNGELTIHETASTELPAGAVSSDIWGNNPVAPLLIETEPSGRKMGVYWEKKFPKYLGGTYIDMDDLPTGMIRLVGRYWHKDSVYTVKLTTGNYSTPTSLGIEVKKPDILGDPNISNESRHTNITDVKGKPLCLDDTIFKYAGEWGIPPQIIKGQIEKETLPHFAFNWRYEPFLDSRLQHNPDDIETYFTEGMPFIVTETSMGTGDLPTLHTNEVPYPYNSSSVKISIYLFQDNNWDSKYVQHHTGDIPDKIVGSNILTKRWAILYAQIKSKNKNITDADARTQAHNKLQAEIQYPKNTIGKNYDNFAQTRIVTSYGLIQMMYTTAVIDTFKETGSRYSTPGSVFMDRYENTLPPEMLNEYDYLFPRYVDFTLQHLRASLGGVSSIPTHEWPGGFESIWTTTIQKHNPGEKDKYENPLYGWDVLARAIQYLPSIKK
ncbi:MAG: hypothetical protein ABSD46_03865 [Bacteroidota bacterium]